MNRKLPRRLWPAILQSRAAVAGVHLGPRCVDGSWLAGRHVAHAHVKSGWICFRNEASMLDEQTVIHELAHLVSGGGHSEPFRKAFLALGGNPRSEHRGEVRKAGRKAHERHSWGGKVPPGLHLSSVVCSRCRISRGGVWPDVYFRLPDGSPVWHRSGKSPACSGSPDVRHPDNRPYERGQIAADRLDRQPPAP